MSRIDENELQDLFAGVEAPAGLDRWRERIADIHAEACGPEDEPHTNGATIVALPTARELLPKRQRTRPVAVAAAAAAVVGLGGIVVTSQVLNDAPPADPTMIIDGPDRTVSSMPSTTSDSVRTSGAQSSPRQSDPGQTHTDQGEVPDGQVAGETRTGVSRKADLGDDPTWEPMVGDPTAANTGVPLGASLADHHGDLRLTTPGEVVTDLRVTGTITVDAPNVTLRRVLVVAPYGSVAVRQNGGGLTVENSELSGGSLVQGAAGLVVRRSRIEGGTTITSGAQLFDSYLGTADVYIPSGSTSLLLRHNTMGRVTMNDLDAAIRDVRVQDSLLTQVDAPTEAGSASIHVLGNRFRGNAPSTGWNPSANDYQWSNNTYADSGAPAYP